MLHGPEVRDLVLAEPGEWSRWVPLSRALQAEELKDTPGLYRVRVLDLEGLIYVGQTAKLRRRLADNLRRAVHGAEIPGNAPHTAGPALWAYRHENPGADYEVSVLPFDSAPAVWKAAESLAISLEREQWQRSPRFQFGRMPTGWTTSSKDKRGEFTGEPREPDQRPMVSLHQDPTDAAWCRHEWSAWEPLEDGAATPGVRGLYRIAGNGVPGPAYVGQGKLRERLMDHLRTARAGDSKKGRALASCGELRFSVVEYDIGNQQILELENDLIASCFAVAGEPPAAQFMSGTAGSWGADRTRRLPISVSI